MTGKQLAEAIEANQLQYAELEAEKQKIIEDTPEARLRRNRAALEQCGRDRIDLERELNALVRSTPLPARHAEVVEALKLAHDRERGLLADTVMGHSRGVPTRFIRIDAVEFYEKQLEEAKAKAAELREKYYGPNHAPGPRVLEEIRDLETVVREWPETKRACELGQRLAEIREERAKLDAEKVEIEEQHRAAVLAS